MTDPHPAQLADDGEDAGQPGFLDLDAMAAAMARGGAPTDDDVTIFDGQRIDTREKAIALVAHLNALPRD